MDEPLQQFRDSWLYHAALFLVAYMRRNGLLAQVPVRVSCGWLISVKNLV